MQAYLQGQVKHGVEVNYLRWIASGVLTTVGVGTALLLAVSLRGCYEPTDVWSADMPGEPPHASFEWSGAGLRDVAKDIERYTGLTVLVTSAAEARFLRCGAELYFIEDAAPSVALELCVCDPYDLKWYRVGPVVVIDVNDSPEMMTPAEVRAQLYSFEAR